MKTYAQADLSPSLTRFLREVRDALISVHGTRLSSLVLFGSQARGEARSDSDVDVLVVLDDRKGPWDGHQVSNAHADLSIDLLLEHEWLLSAITVSRTRYLAQDGPLFWNVAEEGVIFFDMDDTLQNLIDQAREHLDDAKWLIEERKRVRASMELIYYAMFYAAEASLLAEGIPTKSHSGLIQKFGLHLVKSGKIEAQYAKDLARAFEARQQSTYDFSQVKSLDEIRARYKEAEQFVTRIQALLK
mgnify:CR=1 FL=1